LTRYQSIDSYVPIHQKSDTSLLTYVIKMSTIASNSKMKATSLSFTLFQSYVHIFNPLNPELNPIYYLLALLGAHHFLHVSRIGVKSLTFRLLMSYIYMENPFLMFLDHTRRRSTVGRTPLDE